MHIFLSVSIWALMVVVKLVKNETVLWWMWFEICDYDENGDDADCL